MNRSVGLGISFLLITFSVTANEACARESLATLASKTKPAVILIRHFDAGGRTRSQGTGFFITSDGLFVTNHHMLWKPALQKKGVVRSEARTFDGKKYLIKATLAEDSKTDVAIGRIELPPGMSTPYLRLAPHNPKVGQNLIVIGNPKGLAWTVSTGIVSAFRKNFHKGIREGDFVQITAPVTHGSSGSPVMNMKGHVIGVEQSGWDNSVDTARAMLNFASAASNVLALRVSKGSTVREEVEKLYLNDALSAYSKEMVPGKTDQDYAQASDKLGLEYLEIGHYREAESHLKKALGYDPNFAAARYSLGRIYWKRKDKESYQTQLKILEGIDKKRADKLRQLTLE